MNQIHLKVYQGWSGLCFSTEDVPILLPSGQRYAWPKRVLIVGYGSWNGQQVFGRIADFTNTRGIVWETRLHVILKNEWQLGFCLFAGDVCGHMCIHQISFGSKSGASTTLRHEDGGYNRQKTGFDEAVMEEVAWHSLANRQFSLSAQSRDDFCFTLVNVNQWDDGASKLRIKYKVNWNRSSAENSHTRYSAITSPKMPSRRSWATPDELPGFHFLLIHFVFWGQPLRFVQNLLQNELQCCLLPGSAALVGNTGLAQWPCCLVTSS